MRKGSQVIIKEPGLQRSRGGAAQAAPMFTPTDVSEAMDLWELAIDCPESHYLLPDMPMSDDGGWEDLRLALAELAFKRRRRTDGGWDTGGPQGRA